MIVLKTTVFFLFIFIIFHVPFSEELRSVFKLADDGFGGLLSCECRERLSATMGMKCPERLVERHHVPVGISFYLFKIIYFFCMVYFFFLYHFFFNNRNSLSVATPSIIIFMTPVSVKN